MALAWCLLLRLLSLLIGRLGRIACLSSVSTCRLRRKLSSVTWRLRLRTCRLLPQHAPSSAWRTGLPRAGVSSVTVCRRRPCRKTGPPPSFADGKGPRHQLLPAASVSSCSPPWTQQGLAPVAAGPLRQPLFDHRAHVPRPVLSFPLVPRPPSQAPASATAGVVALWTPSATTAQPALGPVSSGAAGALSSGPPREW